MGNHFHLVVQLPHLGLSEGMQLLNSGYAVRTNSRYKRTGHLVRNRFYSQQVETEAHLLKLCRYVVLNPVRAGLCLWPADWPWSSYRATVGLEPAHPFLSTTDSSASSAGTRRARNGATAATSRTPSVIPLPDEPQALQGEEGIDELDRLRMRGDQVR
jgi:hypothetical protein